MYLKSIDTVAVFTSTEMNNEFYIFIKVIALAFNTLILVSFS